ncbi:MAG: hypothetical protein LUQ07_06530, partial [Methanospirillum sp.]|nr:hypothetical protein [Methanospirillum sp.]
IRKIIPEGSVLMGELLIHVPDELPLDEIQTRINHMIQEERLKKSLFDISMDNLHLNSTDSETLEICRRIHF